MFARITNSSIESITGPAVETQKCGGANSGLTGIPASGPVSSSNNDYHKRGETDNTSPDSTGGGIISPGADWECLYGGGESPAGDVPAERPEVRAEVGPGCRCGCVIHLGRAKPRRLIATSSRSCPGRTFWLIQAEKDHVVRFKVDHYRLPCPSQWLKVRDGNGLASPLVAQLLGDSTGVSPVSRVLPPAVISTEPYLLVEFYADELVSMGEVCGGGFLAHAQQITPLHKNTTTPIAQGSVSLSAVLPSMSGVRVSAVHIVAVAFVAVVLLVSAALVTQYVLRYRKYHIAEDMDSLADSQAGSTADIAVPIRAGSASTLLSEVISLRRLRPAVNKQKHARLRESVDCDDVTVVQDNTERLSGYDTALDHDSIGSTSTLQQEKEICSVSSTPACDKDIQETSLTETTSASSLQISPKSSSPLRRSSTFSPSERRSIAAVKPHATTDCERVPEPKLLEKRKQILRRMSNSSSNASSLAGSNTTLTNGYYSPASSVVSTAKIRVTSNPKETKEKRNRAKLLAGPGSEFSLNGNDADLEMDYYDYNVVNAGAAPGSYLGMDPAFLVWIPPLDDSGEILDDLDNTDIQPKEYIDPGSNQESPEGDLVLPTRLKSPENFAIKMSDSELSGNNQKVSNSDSNKKLKEHLGLKKQNKYLDQEAVVSDLNKRESPEFGKHVCIPLQEFKKANEVVKNETFARIQNVKEKEAKVEKFKLEYDDEIKYADEEDDGVNEIDNAVVINN